jgi:DedD protein
MSAENKKLLWIGIAVSAFVLALAVAGVFLFAPHKGAAQAPATINNTAAPKVADPQDYLSVPPELGQSATTPDAASPQAGQGDVIIVYGDKPEDLAPPTAADTAALASSATAAGQASTGGAAAPTATGTTAPAAAATKPAASTRPATTGAATTTATTAARPKASSTAPAAAAPKPSKEQYWIQVASFTKRGNADDLKESLSKKGMAASIMVKDIDGKSWYRVRIGPYASKAEAEGWLAKIRGIAGCEGAGIWKPSTSTM